MSQNPSGIRCPNCQTENRSGAKICHRCGKPLPTPATTHPLVPKNDSPETLRVVPPPSGKPTERLDQVGVPTIKLPPKPFSDLPIGAVVNKRFEVIQLFEAKPQFNGYLTVDTLTQQQSWLQEASNPNQFERERSLLTRQVKHPALVNIVDSFQLLYGPDSRAYLALEFPLTAVSAQGLSELVLLQWGAQLADAVAHLHERGLAHGNIQPANLFSSNNQIKLWGYTHLSGLTPEARIRDVQQLVTTLNQLAQPLGKLSPVAASLFQQRYSDARAFQNDLQKAVDALRHPTLLTTTIGRLSDVGMKREVDEDSLLTTEITQFTQEGSQILGLYAVADGMGGASAGEVASRIATESLARVVTEKILTPRFSKIATGEPDYGTLLKAAVEQANTDVFAERQQRHTDMGTTLVAALLVGNQAYVVNVGDSRAYLVSKDKIEKITKDHSLVQALVDRQQITEAEVRTHPQRNFILRNVGDKAQVQVDLFTVTVAPGQHLLLCCDGLWELVPDDDTLRRIIYSAATPQDAARKLIDTANANGGDDNITCVLVRVETAKGAVQ